MVIGLMGRATTSILNLGWRLCSRDVASETGAAASGSHQIRLFPVRLQHPSVNRRLVVAGFRDGLLPVNSIG